VVDGEGAARAVLDVAGIECAERPLQTVPLERAGCRHRDVGHAQQSRPHVELVLPIRVSAAAFFAVLRVDDVAAAHTAIADQLVGG
jgi:hypothetical protein